MKIDALTPPNPASTLFAVVARTCLTSRQLRLVFASKISATTPATFGAAELVPFITAVYWQLGASEFDPFESSEFTGVGYALFEHPERLVVTIAGA